MNSWMPTLYHSASCLAKNLAATVLCRYSFIVKLAATALCRSSFIVNLAATALCRSFSVVKCQCSYIFCFSFRSNLGFYIELLHDSEYFTKKQLLISFFFLYNTVASSPLNISVLSQIILVHASVLQGV